MSPVPGTGWHIVGTHKISVEIMKESNQRMCVDDSVGRYVFFSELQLASLPVRNL